MSPANQSAIHLVRHARSAIVHDGAWMPHDGVPRYEDAYDAAGIRDDSLPPADVVRLAAEARVFACSDLRRAIESARRLRASDPVIVPDLRELRLEPPRWLPFHLPIEAWDAMSGIQWTWRLLLDSDHHFVRRADAAADWLAARAGEAGSVLGVTHGGIRRIIARRLELRGWRTTTRRLQHHNWSCWSFTRTR